VGPRCAPVRTAVHRLFSVLKFKISPNFPKLFLLSPALPLKFHEISRNFTQIAKTLGASSTKTSDYRAAPHVTLQFTEKNPHKTIVPMHLLHTNQTQED
jgi:hypothetical protein